MAPESDGLTVFCCVCVFKRQIKIRFLPPRLHLLQASHEGVLNWGGGLLLQVSLCSSKSDWKLNFRDVNSADPPEQLEDLLPWRLDNGGSLLFYFFSSAPVWLSFCLHVTAAQTASCTSSGRAGAFGSGKTRLVVGLGVPAGFTWCLAWVPAAWSAFAWITGGLTALRPPPPPPQVQACCVCCSWLHIQEVWLLLLHQKVSFLNLFWRCRLRFLHFCSLHKVPPPSVTHLGSLIFLNSLIYPSFWGSPPQTPLKRAFSVMVAFILLFYLNVCPAPLASV